MTEDEAKSKWCPMTAGVDPAGRSELKDRYPDGHVFAVSQRCITSECMWWVPQTPHETDDNGKKIQWLSGGHCGAIK